MKTKNFLKIALALALTATGATLTKLAAAPPRPQGPCDIYNAAGTPCVAAHSTTRALSASYNGPLYQVRRQSDGKRLDIGLDKPGGYADSAAQDAFCAGAICVINLIYDQSGKGNHLLQAPPGPLFPGPSKGGFDTQPIADMAPITVSGHKAYGVYIMPGMGFRNNNAKGIAIDDEPEGIYYVVDGTHYDSGCCFDYGNSSTNGRAVGTGTMETTYFGTSTVWGSGNGPGPWIMSDMEAGLFSGYNARQNAADPTIDSWRFVTAVVDGGGGNKWDLRGGNAQHGPLTTFYKGVRPGSQTNNSYFPMQKKGGILLGTGGDNGNGSSGTFYEGVMTTGYPSEATTDAVQANIVAAGYQAERLSLSRFTAFTPKSTQELTETFRNSSEAPVTGVRLSLSLPVRWSASAPQEFAGPIAPGATVTAAIKVTAPATIGAGFLTAKAEWKGAAASTETATARIRNVFPVRVNEVRFGTTTNPTDQFIELYNTGPSVVDISNWTVIHTPSQWASVTLATIPSGTKLAGHAFYLLGLSGSGLAAPADIGSATIHVRSTTGFEVGQKIDVDGESRTIVSVGTAASALSTVFEAVSTDPFRTIPAGSTNLPVANATGFEAGQKIAIGLGGNFEQATVIAVGKAGTQTTLSAAASEGSVRIQVPAGANISAADTLTIGTATQQESANVAAVAGTAVDLTAPLKFSHKPGVDVSDLGTGISFAPATRFAHASGDAVQALASGITLDKPLSKSHVYGAPVVNPPASAVGYQGPPEPNQWFGGMLAARAGSIALMDGIVVVDAMVYGSQQSNSSANGTIASPEIATLVGDQSKGGCIVVVPAAASGPGRSRGRFPDGANSDSNCTDFLVQPATTLSAASAAGDGNIKVAGVAEFAAGQTVLIDTGTALETAVIASVGTPGATKAGAFLEAGAFVIPVAGSLGFTIGQTITIDSGANRETAVVASSSGGRGGRGGAGGAATITIAAPLKLAHAAGAQVSGTGIALTGALTKSHDAGAPVAVDLPTPDAPNQYHPRHQ